jgi:hypothetical protein
MYLPSPFFVDFCWIWPDDRVVVHWLILFIAITTLLIRSCVWKDRWFEGCALFCTYPLLYSIAIKIDIIVVEAYTSDFL